MARVSIIVAVADNGVIGNHGDLPWHLSTDLKRLKALTMGHHMIMGRKTYDTLPGPLPGRRIIVVTRNRDFAPPEGVLTAGSVESALLLAQSDDEIFIAGGGEIFAQSLHRADRMYLTRVHAEPEGDAFFPEFDDVNEWRLIDSEHFEADAKNDHPFSFLTYERVGAEGHAVPESG
jgi:dihydrofolate reductase